MRESAHEPRDGIEAVVVEVFQEMLHRPPSADERTEWSAKLLRGVPVRVLREALAASPDRRTPETAAATPDAAIPDINGPLARVIAAGLFDAVWYGNRYPDVVAADMRPADHYMSHGAAEDRWPNPWFDPIWYRATHGLALGEPALPHYAELGEARNLRPSPHFDPGWYRMAYGLNEKKSPLAEFLRLRHTRTVAPSAELWPALGVVEPALTPVADDVFLSIGEANAAEFILRDAGLFDENYYALHSGDVLAAGTDLLTHYCEFGWREMRAPNFYFDHRWYVATNPEVERLGVNPLAHYVLMGEPEGRRPIVFFEPAWYAETYQVPDDLSPLAHFLAHRREGVVSPNRYFDPSFYAAAKGEKIRPGRDPFARFLVTGLTEDIAPSPAFDPASWRRRNMGRVSRNFRHLLDPCRDNPLVNFMLSSYR